MTTRHPRRAVLAGLVALAATPSVALAPSTSLRPVPRGEKPPRPAPPPATGLVNAAGLGGSVGFLVVNAETGEVVEGFNPDQRLPPASVAKAATAHYALTRLGPDHRFRTELVATGPIANGILDGDLILRGGGDPHMDTDGLAGMIEELKALGVAKVNGALRMDASALPLIPFIDPDQPDHVGYNPPVAGLNLNFNRVHFEWKRGDNGYDITMEARAHEYRPEVAISRMSVVDRSLPVYSYESAHGIDRWTVARAALGKGGARWLPVKRPVEYTAEVFQTVAKYHGLTLKRGPDAPGVEGEVLVRAESAALRDMSRAMLKYSTNLTAEALGLSATRSEGVQPETLIRSAREMNQWFNRELGCHSCGFVDHSGLGYGSRVSARDMVRILLEARKVGILQPILKDFNSGADGVKVAAKTGTLNFVSALAGFIDAKGTPPLAFAIFTADMPRRDAIDVSQRERPPGAQGWASRSRNLQKQLINRWAALAA